MCLSHVQTNPPFATSKRSMSLFSALRFAVLLGLTLLLMQLSGCDQPPAEKTARAPVLKVFSGITMVKPLQKIATEFERRTGVKVEIQQGATGLIYKTLVSDRQGDVFFPGSERLRLRDQNHPDNIFGEHVLVGYNRLAIMVPKGNPKHLNNDLHQLTDPNLSVVVATVNSSSVGQESKKVLDKLGLTTQVYDNITYFTTDSHRLTSALQQKHADVVLNWYATSFWPENREIVDVITIDPNVATLKRLEISVLNFSTQPALAKRFLDLARSEFGLNTFAEFGFLTPAELAYELELNRQKNHKITHSPSQSFITPAQTIEQR